MESQAPLTYYDDLEDDDLKSEFDQLLNAIYNIDSNSSEEEILALNQRVCREVTPKPILARIVQYEFSLLVYFCTIPNKLFHPAIKCLIKANP